MADRQLALFAMPVHHVADPDRRHGEDLSDHQHGQFVVTWTPIGGGWQPGDLKPAWICCVCGGVEPTEFDLDLNHDCGSVTGSAVLHSLRSFPGKRVLQLETAA